MLLIGLGICLCVALYGEFIRLVLSGEKLREIFRKIKALRVLLRFAVGSLACLGIYYLVYERLPAVSVNGMREILVLLTAAAIFFILYGLVENRKCLAQVRKEQSFRQILWAFHVVVLIVCCLELFVFNFRHYQSLGEEPMAIDLAQISCGRGLVEEQEGIYLLTSNVNGRYLEFDVPNVPADNIYLDLSYLNDIYGGTPEVVKMELQARDEGNSEYYGMPTYTLVPGLVQSQYIKLNLSGNLRSLRILFKDTDTMLAKYVGVNGISLNAHVPVNLAVKRMAFLLVVLFLLYLIRPKSWLYRYRYAEKWRGKKLILVAYVAVLIGMFHGWAMANPHFQLPVSYIQYHELAEAMAEGQVSLLTKPSKALEEMDNPYDYFERNKVVREEEGEDYLWDHAYYDGNYYVYFGVVPEVVFFLPYYLITGEHLPVPTASFLTGVVLLLAVLGLLGQVIRKWFPGTSFITYLIFATMMFFCSGMLYGVRRPDFYNLTILMGLMFTVAGLYFWMSSIREERISTWRIALGSLCMALVAGCRPQLLVGSVFAFVIFWDAVFRKRLLFSKKGFKDTVAAILPFVIVAALLMYYNAIRFGSVFDFGSNYNLTGNDMTHRGFKLDRIGLGLFYYLFQTPQIGPLFPFVYGSSIRTYYMGITVWETFFGGMAAVHPILFLGLFPMCFRKYFQEKSMYVWACLCSAFALLIIVMDTEMAGILIRYFLDFGWLLFLSTFLVLFSMLDRWRGKPLERYVNLGIFLCFIAGMAYQLCFLFTDVNLSMEEKNPLYYYNMYYLVQFWL